MGVQKQMFMPFIYLDALGGFRGELARYARTIVRAADEKQKPSNQRIRGYQDSALPTLEQRLFSTAPVYKSLEQLQLAESLTEMQDVLGADNDVVKMALAGKSPDERAKELIAGTKLDDVAVRKQLYEGGKAAVDASTDPLIVMMREVEPTAAALHQRDEDEVQSVLRRNGGNIGKALFAKEGLSVPPDATFTLRLSYGAVEGYKLNGKNVPWFTTMGGAYEHAAEHGSKPPYRAAGELDEVQSRHQSEDAVRHGFHARHHRRQFGQSGDQQGRRSGGHHLRRQHRVAGLELRVQRQGRHARWKWIRGRSSSRCGTSTTPTRW